MIDIDDFLPNDLGDVTDDGVPDQFDDKDGDGLPDIPEGRHGIWDDLIGAKTTDEFLAEVDFTRQTVDFDDAGSMLIGPCGGLAISYDADGNSIDAAVDRADDDPPVDVLTGDQAFTESNPFRVDASGVVAYFGFTPEDSRLSLRGVVLPPEEYAPDAIAFHDHRWEVVIVEVSADDGGDPNEGDDNRNAALVELNDILPFPFRAKLKARGGIIDLWGPGEAAVTDEGQRRGHRRRPGLLLRRRLGRVRRRRVPAVHHSGRSGAGDRSHRIQRSRLQRPSRQELEGLTWLRPSPGRDRFAEPFGAFCSASA